MNSTASTKIANSAAICLPLNFLRRLGAATFSGWRALESVVDLASLFESDGIFMKFILYKRASRNCLCGGRGSSPEI